MSVAGPLPRRSHHSAQSGLEFMTAVVPKWSDTRLHLREHRPRFMGTLERIERHPAVAAVFARHWPR
jgi:GST-like protein